MKYYGLYDIYRINFEDKRRWEKMWDAHQKERNDKDEGIKR